MRVLLCLITAAWVLVTGMMRLISPPREPHFGRGYRSTLAMRNQATWQAAQRESAVALIAAGTVGLILSWLMIKLVDGDMAIAASSGISAALAALTVAWTEKRLSLAFDTKGKRRRAGGTEDEEA